MSSGMPELGSKISLISKADIRYEGRLFTVDPTECTIALANVRSFGTEDRETQYPIAPQSQIYDYILFRGTDIKDIRVVNNGMPHPNDPAIMQMQLPNGQHLMPHFPMPTMNPPIGGYANPFGTMSNLGGLGSSSLAPGSFILGGGNSGASGNQKPKSELNDVIPDPTVTSTISVPNAPTAAIEHKDQVSVLDLLTGASRSTTPVSLVSRKSPSADMAVQVNQNMGGGRSDGMHNRDVGQNKRQNHHQQHQQQRNGSNNQQRGGGLGGGSGNDGNRIRRDSGKMYQAQDNRNHQHQRNNQNNNQNNRGWINRNNNMRGNRGRGRMIQNQGGYRQPGNPNKGGRPPKNTIKFEQDYDFEQANSKFEELRSQLSKLKVGDDAKTDQVNGEVDKKDDSGNETGAGDHEQEEEEIVVGYDKTKSFFDNISCEAGADRSKGKNRNDWRQERKLNSETFGISSTRRNNYRGRGGGYYNRNMNAHGGYNRGYRGNYRPRNNMNNRNGQPSTGLPNKNTTQNQIQQGQQQNQPQQQQQSNTTATVAATD